MHTALWLQAGPWQGSAFLSIIHDAARDYFGEVPPEKDEMLRFLAEPIAAEMGISIPAHIAAR